MKVCLAPETGLDRELDVTAMELGKRYLRAPFELHPQKPHCCGPLAKIIRVKLSSHKLFYDDEIGAETPALGLSVLPLRANYNNCTKLFFSWRQSNEFTLQLQFPASGKLDFQA